MTRRTDRIATLIEQAVGKVLARGLADPRIKGLITVTSVRLTDDLARATILVSITPRDKQRVALAGLTAAARHIRHEASNLIDLRRMPQLFFELDEGLQRQVAVEEALALIARERQAGAATPDHDPQDPHAESHHPETQAPDAPPSATREINPS